MKPQLFSRFGRKGRDEKGSSRPKRRFGRVRSFEILEDRQLLALLGLVPTDFPQISYDNRGTISYNAAEDLFTVHAGPTGFVRFAGDYCLAQEGSFDINIRVGESGNLLDGVPGNDLVLTGKLDVTGDFGIDVVGDATNPLLTGEIYLTSGFGWQNGIITDDYDFRFHVTGGQLATTTYPYFSGKDVGVRLGSESSSFSGSFTSDFSGGAKGVLWPLEPIIVPSPGVNIVKLTNGTNNNSPTGPVVPVGSTVTFAYVVTNTGNVPLASVAVTDDQGVTPIYQSGDTDSDQLLDVTETWTYAATATAVAGQYANTGTVTGNPVDENGNDIPGLPDQTDSDIDHYFGATAGVNIIKLTNGTDNNSPTGPVVPVGSTVTFTYVVTNTGNVPLASVAVTDDQGVTPIYQSGDTDGDQLLDVTETWTYVATATAVAGQYANTGTVTGNPVDENGNDIPGLPDQTDSDIDHYLGVAPAIDIEKTTNGPSNSNPTAPDYDNEDSPSGPGVPLLSAGSTVTWTYKVTNTGNVAFALSEVVVVDDNGTPDDTTDDLKTTNNTITFQSVMTGDDDTLLEPGEVWLYTASGIVQNLTTPGMSSTFDFSGSSALDGPDGNIRTFTAGSVSVNTSAFSRDKSTGAWSTAYLGSYSGGLGVTDTSESGSNDTHTVDNVGRDNYVLFEFSETVIVDSAYLGYVVCDSDMTVWIGTVADPFHNHMTLSDEVLSSLGFTEVSLTDLTTARWADLNAGNLAGNVLVVAAWTGDATPEDRFKIKNVTIREPQPGIYENKATVTAPGAPSDSDLSHYKNPTVPANPDIDIEKFTNGKDADEPDGCDVPEISPGDVVTWTYKVTNTGNVAFALAEVVVRDDNGTPGNSADDFTPTFVASSDAGGDEILLPGETWIYTATATAQTLATTGPLRTVNFDKDAGGNYLSKGTIVDTEYAAWGLTISARSNTSPAASNRAMIFDSANPTGGDTDLRTPGYHATNQTALGKILIISEDGDTTDPDDDANGGLITFEWDRPVTVDSISLLDIDCDERGGLIVTFFTPTGSQSIPIPTKGDNSFQKINLDRDDVIRMEVNFVSSGAVTELVFHDQRPGVYGNIATATAGGESDQDASHYRNPQQPCGGEGLTPGYWKQCHHFDDWVGYRPSDSVNGVFGISLPGDTTLLKALQSGGGGINAMLRHAVAALLNASHPQIDYAYTPAQVIGMVQQAVESGSYEQTKDRFEVENERGADLDDGLGLMSASTGPASIAGRVYRDLNNNKRFDAGELGIGGITISLEDERGHLVATVSTADDGTYRFADLVPGTFTIVQGQEAIELGHADGEESIGSLGGDIPANDRVRILLDAADEALGYDFGEITGATVQGVAWEDSNGNNEVDFGEKAIAGTRVRLTGTNDRNEAVDLVVTTDDEGLYVFKGLRPSDANGYTVSEEQPAGYQDGPEILGTVAGIPAGLISGNDRFAGIQLQSGDCAEDFNFAELPSAPATETEFIRAGQTATVAFWKNRHGKALIRSLNGGPDATDLANWLAVTFPNMYSHLQGKTNAEVAKLFAHLVNWRTMLEAQAMAVALAVYVTDENLAGTVARQYGFLTSQQGVGAAMFDVDEALWDGSAQILFGCESASVLSVMTILDQVDARSGRGVIFGGSDGRLQFGELLLRWMSTELFTAINEAGSIV